MIHHHPICVDHVPVVYCSIGGYTETLYYLRVRRTEYFSIDFAFNFRLAHNCPHGAESNTKIIWAEVSRGCLTIGKFEGKGRKRSITNRTQIPASENDIARTILMTGSNQWKAGVSRGC